MKTLFVAMLLILAGSTYAGEVYLPDGTKGFTVDCSGAFISWNSCYKKAGKICKEKGYTVVDRSDNKGGVIAGGGGGVWGAKGVTKSLLIKCGKADEN